ncbi:MAG: class I SAM-dependent methyltransferase [Candidatus Hodarchaeota archaeon]
MSREQSERIKAKDQINTLENAEYLDMIYKDQLTWTVSTRKGLYRQMNLFHAKKVLEVGSGTNALINEIQEINPRIFVVGTDKNLMALTHVINKGHSGHIVHGEGASLPYIAQCFDITLCHYFLMWANDPLKVLQEMVRVTKIGGWVACLAEPDYGGRLDYPNSDLWKKLVLDSLSAVDPYIGRKLPSLFFRAGLKARVGVQSTVFSSTDLKNLYAKELEKLERFLPSDKRGELKKLKQFYSKNLEESFSFMPVFYAIARKDK